MRRFGDSRASDRCWVDVAQKLKGGSFEVQVVIAEKTCGAVCVGSSCVTETCKSRPGSCCLAPSFDWIDFAIAYCSRGNSE